MIRKKKIASKPDPAESFEESLKVIYEDAAEEKMDFSKLEVRRHSTVTRVLLWLMITLLVLGGAAFGGFLLFQNLFTNNQNPLIISLDGPDEIISGETATFDLLYENTGSVPITALEIKLMVPDGFQLTSFDPAPTEEPYVWKLGTLTSNSDDRIRVSGIWTAEVPSSQTMQAITSFRPANYNAEFQNITTKIVKVENSIFTITTDGPDTAAVGAETSYSYTIKNTGTQKAEDLWLHLDLPDTFFISSSEPISIPDTYEWEIGTLEPEAEYSLVLTGAFSADATGVYTLTSHVGVKKEETILEQTSLAKQTDIVGGGLNLRMLVNGSIDDQVVDPGETLRLSLDVLNSGSENASGLEMTLSIKNDFLIDWTEADLGGGTRSGQAIYWSSKALKQAGLLPKDGQETVDLSLPLELNPADNTDSLSFSLQATVAQMGSVQSERTLESSPLTLTLNTNTSFATEAFYYLDGVAVGSGPLPPEVDQTTSYRVRFALKNTMHALNDVVVSATIPPNVNYLGNISVDMGDLAFNETTRTLTWKISRLTTSIPNLEATFDLAVTPKTDDIGKFIKLINEATLGATDATTNLRLKRDQSALTTDLTTDPDAADKGAVVE